MATVDWFRRLKMELLEERPWCEICGAPGTDLHHCLVHDMKRYHRELTCKENLQVLCSKCHTSLEQGGDVMDNRLAFVEAQIKRGYDIPGWYRNLPLKVKEQWLLRMPRVGGVMEGDIPK